MRCSEFYEKWQREPNWCEKCPSSVSQITSYLKLVDRLEKLGADREKVFKYFPELTARPYFQEKDVKKLRRIVQSVNADKKPVEESEPDKLTKVNEQFTKVNSQEKEFSAEEEWKWAQMPEFIQENKEGVQQIIVHFETQEDVEKFAELTNQKITKKTKYIWFPKKERQNLIDWVYVEDI